MNNQILKVAGIVLVVIVLIYGVLVFDIGRKPSATDYASCVALGNPILESYPEQCIDNGITYTREIPEPKVEDEIVVEEPVSGSSVSSPLTLSGMARGNWYFEASFPIQIIDAKGIVIGESYVQAQGDWMTEDFVPFEGTISFGTTTEVSGVLRLKNDNPSGMPEYDKHIDIPVMFKTSSISNTGTTTLAACRPTGCSSQICSDQDVVTNCMYKEEYACYKTAECKRQSNGQCGWTETTLLAQCIGSAQ